MSPSPFDVFREKASGARPAGFAAARATATSIPLDDLASASDATIALARVDAAAKPGDRPRASRLDVAIERAERLLSPCRLCGLLCEVDRRAGPAGRCGLGPGLRVYADLVHAGEELELVPAHAVFLAGCSYRCAYCSDWDHVATPLRDPETREEDLARSIDLRRGEGAACVEFVGGEPLVSVPALLRMLRLVRTSTPVVLTTNAHATEATLDVLSGLVDAWVIDAKHAAPRCAWRIARAPAHAETVLRTLARAHRETLVIVRHLILPGHADCCSLPLLDRVAEVAPGVRVNVMGQYRPTPRVAASTSLGRRPDAHDVDRVRARALALGLRIEPLGSPLPPRPANAPRAGPAVPPAELFIDPDGRVTFRDLTPDLADVAHALAPDDEEVRARRDASAPWRAAAD